MEGWIADADGRPVLKLRVSAAAADGAANAAVLALIARSLGLPRSAVRIAGGETGRIKRLEIEGADAAAIRNAFGGT